MLRASVTAAVMVVLVILLGTPLFLLGLIYPSPRAMALATSIWARGILLCSGVKLTMVGRERIGDGAARFFLGNHQSALDIPIVIAGLNGRVRFMAKDSLFAIPLFGWVIRRYGYMPVDRKSARKTYEALEATFQELRRRPASLAVFPEGTRSPDPRLRPFRRGSIKVAQRSGLAVVPFSIDGSIRVHHHARFEAHPGPVTLTFGEPIPAEEVAAMTQAALHDRVRGVIARQLGQVEEPCDDDGQSGTLPSPNGQSGTLSSPHEQRGSSLSPSSDGQSGTLPSPSCATLPSPQEVA